MYSADDIWNVVAIMFLVGCILGVVGCAIACLAIGVSIVRDKKR